MALAPTHPAARERRETEARMLLATDTWDEKTPVEWVPSAVYDRRVHAIEQRAAKLHTEMRTTQGLSIAAMVVAITLSVLATRGLSTISDVYRVIRAHEVHHVSPHERSHPMHPAALR